MWNLYLAKISACWVDIHLYWTLKRKSSNDQSIIIEESLSSAIHRKSIILPVVWSSPTQGLLPWHSHFTFVTFKLRIFTVIFLPKFALVSLHLHIFKSKFGQRFISSNLTMHFCHASQKTSMPPNSQQWNVVLYLHLLTILPNQYALMLASNS